MFDLGWQELLLVAVVTLLVVGPKDLPKLFNKAGKLIGNINDQLELYRQIGIGLKSQLLYGIKRSS